MTLRRRVTNTHILTVRSRSILLRWLPVSERIQPTKQGEIAMNAQQVAEAWEPDEVDLGLLERVRNAPPNGISVWDLKDEFEIDEGSIFDRMATWIRRGEPICFSCVDGSWQSFHSPEDMVYWIAKEPEELDHVVHMIKGGSEYLSDLLKGVDCNQQRLRRTGEQGEE